MKKKNPNPELIDEENPEWTEEMFVNARPLSELLPELAAYAVRKKAGRPKEPGAKKLQSFKLSPDVIDAIRATGAGYNVRVENVLRAALAEGRF